MSKYPACLGWGTPSPSGGKWQLTAYREGGQVGKQAAGLYTHSQPAGIAASSHSTNTAAGSVLAAVDSEINQPWAFPWGFPKWGWIILSQKGKQCSGWCCNVNAERAPEDRPASPSVHLVAFANIYWAYMTYQAAAEYVMCVVSCCPHFMGEDMRPRERSQLWEVPGHTARTQKSWDLIESLPLAPWQFFSRLKALWGDWQSQAGSFHGAVMLKDTVCPV